ncbi:hypothetical protein BGZ76_005905 [Entomortierella beljakovae]|nr:hypothetical protein BGZ76_005905 [Entomortierella beljakovae]
MNNEDVVVTTYVAALVEDGLRDVAPAAAAAVVAVAVVAVAAVVVAVGEVEIVDAERYVFAAALARSNSVPADE